jgi:DnaJ-class molecular chaperone
MSNDSVNYYEILGVDPQATIDEIKIQRYRMLLAYHPDHNKSSMANEMTQHINAGWEILSDPARRQEYDETLKREPLSNKSTAPQHSPTKSRHRGSRRRVRKETRESPEQSARYSPVNSERKSKRRTIIWKDRLEKGMKQGAKIAFVVLKISFIVLIVVLALLSFLGGGRRRRSY